MSAGEGSPSSRGVSALSPKIVHGTCVAVDGKAVLIQGASGAGKSSLALQMMALGAGLVADDRTRLRCHADQVIADAPEPIRGQIEARGIGLLCAPSVGPTPVTLVVDLDEVEADRLPKPRVIQLLGMERPLLRNCAAPHFPSALMIYLRGGPVE